MLAQGTDLYVVSEVLGHSSVAITKDVYGHLVEGQKRAAATLDVGGAARRHWLPKWLPRAADFRDCGALPSETSLVWLGQTLAHPEGFEPPTF